MANLGIYSRAQIDALVASSGAAEWELRSDTFTDTLVAGMMTALEAGTLAQGPLPQPTGTTTPAQAAFSAFVAGVGSDISSIGATLASGGSGLLEGLEAVSKLAKFWPLILAGVVGVVIYLKVK